MNKELFTPGTLCLLILFLVACSEAPKTTETKKEPPKPPEPVSGLTAFYEMYKPARTWAKDDVIELQLPMTPEIVRGYETEFPSANRKYFNFEPDPLFQPRNRRDLLHLPCRRTRYRRRS